ncbi:ATP-binding cassette domain-containing protein [Erythrobacter arachoides]|uniref:ATP-binding cassette domain-containing protein n=1 Tax=Aurantiacibacter arachoides TaxID=1850444 RepID=A0A844ZX17_9SPHN|nr:ABC transporter transmembrane domain-containing protein [Aurantiacibacter arachoides]MXO92004.1 ATP-binding cassette domain-containing protein [Aurantiacibacter arachoides]GGD60511.1 ABC transporter ATP-binding protein [Aurantiacibacter arachoides]
MALPPAQQTSENEPKPARSLGPLRMIFREAAKYPVQYSVAMVALLVTATVTSLALPSALRLIIDRGFGGDGDVGRWFRYLLVLVGILGLGTAVRFYFISWLGERVVADVRTRVYDNLLRLSPSFFEENSPKEISSRMVADTAIIEQVVGTTLSVALRNAIMAIFGIGYLFWLAPQLAMWLVMGLPLVMIPLVIFGRRLKGISRDSQDRVADVGGITTEVLSAMKIVQGFNQEIRESGRFQAAVERTFATAKVRIMIRAVMTALLITLIFGGLVLLLWRGAVLVTTGEISGGTIGAFIFAGVIVAGSAGALTEVMGDLLRGAGAASRLGELMAEQPCITAPARPQALPEPPRGSLAFAGVTFSYPTRPEDRAIEDFTLTIEPGETVAIVGPSGAGKSTVFQLAERFYDPQSGTIKLDGVPLTQADPAAIRRRMALVPQEGILFAASARDNLRYGAWDASEEAIWEAARAANAETFLRSLPDGLDTFLGEGGARLSGGQRQRVAIARALLRDAPILLLDEATSALDAESERLVQDALERLMANRTTLVIAHRLATVRAADRIVVMEGGRIVEIGDHAGLSADGGLYARLATLQFETTADAPAAR